MVTSLLGVSACTPAAVKQIKVNLPPGGQVEYMDYAEFDSFLPDWYRMYSIASGAPKPMASCAARQTYKGAQRRVSIINCSRANQTQLDELAKSIQQTVDQVEVRFDHSMHVANVTLELFDAGDGFDRRFTHRVRPQHLSFELADTYDVEQSGLAEREIVESVAHELFHIGRHMGRHDNIESTVLRLSEETRAYLFGYCVENDVFGSLEPQAFNVRKRFAPHWLADSPVGNGTTNGGVRATMTLVDIAGGDRALSTEAEKLRFSQVCHALVR